MKYEIIKGSEKDFEGVPANVLTLYRFAGHIDLHGSLLPSIYTHISGKTETIAERRPITEPELKPIYGDGIHDDSDALQQRIDMGIDIKPILNNGVFLTLKPLQFKTITEPVWDGEGLPPVGVECEILWNEYWVKCVVKAYGEEQLIFKAEGSREWAGHINNYKFRPIRSPEDVARDGAIAEMRLVGYTLPAGIAFSISKEEMAEIYDAIAAGKIKGVVLESKVSDLEIHITTDEMWREFEKNSDMEDVYKLIRERASRRGSF